jgi:hypothetical protein
MKKSMKAVLLSAFVFPGAGHFFLKKHLTGTVLAGSAFISLYLVVSKTVERALQIFEKIQLGEVPPDITTITELVTRQSTGTDAKLLNIASAVLIISLLIGLIDSYRVGRAQDKSGVTGG